MYIPIRSTARAMARITANFILDLKDVDIELKFESYYIINNPQKNPKKTQTNKKVHTHKQYM